MRSALLLVLVALAADPGPLRRPRDGDPDVELRIRKGAAATGASTPAPMGGVDALLPASPPILLCPTPVLLARLAVPAAPPAAGSSARRSARAPPSA